MIDEYVDLCHEFDTDDPCGCHVDYAWMAGCQNRCDKCPTCFACSGEVSTYNTEAKE